MLTKRSTFIGLGRPHPRCSVSEPLRPAPIIAIGLPGETGPSHRAASRDAVEKPPATCDCAAQTTGSGPSESHPQQGVSGELRRKSLCELPGTLSELARGGWSQQRAGVTNMADQVAEQLGCEVLRGSLVASSHKSVPYVSDGPGTGVTARSPKLFRERALNERGRDEPLEHLPSVGSNQWALLAFAASTVLTVLVFACVGHVEVTSVAAGVLLVNGGPRPVLAQVSGEVASLAVNPGDTVEAGQEVARVRATELRARTQRAKEQLDVLRATAERLTAERDKRFEQARSALARKRQILVERDRLKRQSIPGLKTHAEGMVHFEAEGMVLRTERLASGQALLSAQEGHLQLQQQIAETDRELSDLAERHSSESEHLRRELEEAEVSLAESRKVTELEVARAPVAGQVESLLVAEGQVVLNGSPLVQITPKGTSTTVVAFAPIKDGAFLCVGREASIEFASLPVSEFGKAKAEVTRVSTDVATREEVANLLGISMSEPVIRVELRLLPSLSLEKAKGRLRPGERVTARINTRKRRIITLFFDFLRKWYPT